MDGRAHATRLEGNTNENFATSAVEIVPLILSGHVVKVWGELDTAEEDVVAHVVVSTTLWLFLAQVRLQRYLRIAGYITVGVTVNTDGRQGVGYATRTSGPDTCKEAFRGHHREE